MNRGGEGGEGEGNGRKVGREKRKVGREWGKEKGEKSEAVAGAAVLSSNESILPTSHALLVHPHCSFFTFIHLTFNIFHSFTTSSFTS